jgi:NADPH:quinone reductase-like Zn-dependent oxidoreductase
MKKNAQMKAIVYKKYGPPEVLKLKEVGKPTPNEDEVLIKVQAASVNYSDWAFVRGKPYTAEISLLL